MATLNVVYKIGADISSMQRDMNRAATRTEKLQRGFVGLGRALIVGGAATALGAIARGAIKAASDFESSFTGVRKTVNATEAEFAALEQGFRNMSKEIPISVNELNRIGESAGQLGIKTENILGFTRVMADLGVTTNLSADEAATALARLANITGMAQSDFDRAGSAIVELGNNFATTEAEIVDFGTELAASASLVGVTVPQILAIGTALSSLGIRAESGRTAIQKVFLGMNDAVLTGGKAMTTFAEVSGIAAKDFGAAFRDDAGKVFEQFVAGLGKQGVAASLTLTELGLGSERTRKVLLALAGSGDLLTRAFASAEQGWVENIALAEEAQKRYETFQSQVILLKNLFGDLGITIGRLLLPIMASMVSGLQAMLLSEEGVRDVTMKVSGALVLMLKSLDLAQLFFRGAAVMALQLAQASFEAAKGLIDLNLSVLGLGKSVPGLNRFLGITADTEAELNAESDRLMRILLETGSAIDDITDDSIRWGNALTHLQHEINQAAEASVGESTALNVLNAAIRDAEAALEDFNEEQGVLVTGAAQSVNALAALVDGWVTVEQAQARVNSALSRDVVPSLNTITWGMEQFGGSLPTGQLQLFNTSMDTSRMMLDPMLGSLRAGSGILGEQTGALESGGSAWVAFGKSIQSSLGDIGLSLGTVVASALQGGGNIGESLGGAIGGGLGSAIGVAIGGTLGTVIGSIAGPIGAVAGAMLGDVLANIGGPSEAELAGRQTADAFRRGIVDQLSSADIIEIESVFGAGSASGTSGFLFGVDKAFTDIGFSAAEAHARTVAFADALHRAEANGPAAVQAVVDGFTQLVSMAKELEQAEIDLTGAIADRAALLRTTLVEGASSWTAFVESGLAAGQAVPEAFAAIIGAQDLMNSKWAPLIDGANAGTDAMLALGTTGNLNQESFLVFSRAATNVFNRLIAGGADSNSALEAMRPTLAALLFAQENYGLKVGASTQKILDQASAFGITAAEGETAADRQLRAFDELIDSLNDLIALLRGALPAAINGLPDAHIQVKVDDSEFAQLRRQALSFQNSFGIPSFAQGSGGVQDFGRGTLAMLHGREEVVPEGQRSSGSGSDEIASLRRDMQHTLPALMADAIRSALMQGGVGRR